MTDPTVLTLYERPPCGYGCAGCPSCRPQVPLAPDIAAALASTTLVSVTPTTEAGVFALATTRKIGSVTVDFLTVRVEPKTPISNVLWMMGYTRNPSWWSRQTTLVGTAADFVEALAEAFVIAAEQAIAQGLLSGYREVEEPSTVLRGRLRVGEQITRRFALVLPVEVRYDEYDEDIPENQLLLAATLILLSNVNLPGHLSTRMARIRQSLADVTAPTRGAEPAWISTRLNLRYHWALHLAELIIEHSSVEHRIGNVTIRSFVVDMWKVFEDFLMTTLSDAIGRRGGRGLRPGTNTTTRYLDQARTVVIEPDLLWSDASNRPITVIDAKYKMLTPGKSSPNADLYQLTAYCTALGLREGHLIYATGETHPRPVEVIGADITIRCHTLDLTLPPSDLLLSVEKFVADTERRFTGRDTCALPV